MGTTSMPCDTIAEPGSQLSDSLALFFDCSHEVEPRASKCRHKATCKHCQYRQEDGPGKDPRIKTKIETNWNDAGRK